MPIPTIAIVQQRMFWSGEENTAEVVRTIEQAAAAGADICLFPELAITGYHRQIASVARPESVQPWLESARTACARHAVAAAIGVPTFTDDGRILNSYVTFDKDGSRVSVVDKIGLTEAEAQFFARGNSRPTTQLHDLRFSSVMCREVEDLEEVCATLEGDEPHAIFWPGLMSPEKGTEHLDPPRHVQQAQALAARLGAYVIQSNWPMSLNYPDLSAGTGRSVVIRPTGEIAFSLPQAEAGFAVFEFGASGYAWHGLSGG